MTWDNVEMIRNAQASAKARFEATALATQDEIQKVINSEAAKGITIPRLTEIEQMIFKMRSELIDYIVAHGLVDGLIWDGVLQPIQNGKIVVTKEMIEILTEHLGYFTEADVQAFLEQYLPENHYVSDASYVHTDNNFTSPEKDKLAGIEAGAEVNKIIDVIFNGTSVLDDGTRVATITITPEDIKRWYEENPDTNAFTDAQKAKLAGISDGAEVNRVDDVLVDGRSVLADDKKAKITPEDIKKAYEKNPDTNAFTDAEKADLATLKAWKPEAEGDIANNSAEIAEAKQSISELGDEVNTVAGRVTTLETNTAQLRTDVDSLTERVTTTEGTVDGLAKRVTQNEIDIHAAQSTATTALNATNDLSGTVNDQARSIESLESDKLPYSGATQGLFMGEHSIHTDGFLVTGPTDGAQTVYDSGSIRFTDTQKITGQMTFVNDAFHLDKTLEIVPPVSSNDAANKAYVDNVLDTAKQYTDSKIQTPVLVKVDADKITTEADIVLVVVRQATSLATKALHRFRIDQEHTWDAGASETLNFKESEHFLMLPHSQSTSGTRTFYSDERKPGIKVYYDGSWGVYANGIHGTYNTALYAYANEYRGFQVDPTDFSLYGYKFS